MDPSILASLAQLSAPGYNRAIGSGDVVPYWGPQQNQQAAGGAGVAEPGASYDPGAMGGPTGSIGAGGGSVLNNLSVLTPILNQIVQQQQQDSIVSGQGNAQANPLPGATPGAGSADIAQQVQASAGALPIASAGGVPGIAPPTGGSTPSGAPGADAGAAPGGAGATGGSDAGGGVGDSGAGVGTGDSGAGAGTGNGTGDAGVAGPGDAGVSGGPAAGTSGGPGVGDGGGGAGGGGAAGTVICTELKRQGYLDACVWTADAEFGRMQSRATRAGYHLWAAPVARGMARSRVLTVVVASLAVPWAKEMAFQMGVRPHGSRLGRVVMAIGLPLCTFLGRHIKIGVRA